MEELGEETFAVVKKAKWNKSDDENVDIVKIIREAAENLKQDFIDEIKIISQLGHPNLISNYGGSSLNKLRSQKKPKLFTTQLLEY